MRNVNVVNKISCFCLIIFFLRGDWWWPALATRWLRHWFTGEAHDVAVYLRDDDLCRRSGQECHDERHGHVSAQDAAQLTDAHRQLEQPGDQRHRHRHFHLPCTSHRTRHLLYVHNDNAAVSSSLETLPCIQLASGPLIVNILLCGPPP